MTYIWIHGVRIPRWKELYNGGSEGAEQFNILADNVQLLIVYTASKIQERKTYKNVTSDEYVLGIWKET